MNDLDQRDLEEDTDIGEEEKSEDDTPIAILQKRPNLNKTAAQQQKSFFPISTFISLGCSLNYLFRKSQ
jgi:hypothetical protein